MGSPLEAPKDTSSTILQTNEADISEAVLACMTDGSACGASPAACQVASTQLGVAATKPTSDTCTPESAAFNEQLQRLRARLQSVVQGVREVAQSLDEPHTLIASVRDQLQNRRESTLHSVIPSGASIGPLTAISCPLDVTGVQVSQPPSTRCSADDLEPVKSTPHDAAAGGGNDRNGCVARSVARGLPPPAMSVKALVAAVERHNRSAGGVPEVLSAASSLRGSLEGASVESLPLRTTWEDGAAMPGESSSPLPHEPQAPALAPGANGAFANALAAAITAAGSPALQRSGSLSAASSGSPATPVTAAQACCSTVGGSGSGGPDARASLSRTGSGTCRLRSAGGSAKLSPATAEDAVNSGAQSAPRGALFGDSANAWANTRSASFGVTSSPAADGVDAYGGVLLGTASIDSGLLANAAATAAYLDLHPETLRELWTLRAKVRAQEGELASMVMQLSTKNAALDQTQAAVQQKDKELSALTQRLAGVLSRLQAFQAAHNHQLQQQQHLAQYGDGGPRRRHGAGTSAAGSLIAAPGTPSPPHNAGVAANPPMGPFIDPSDSAAGSAAADAASSADAAPTVAAAKALFTALGLPGSLQSSPARQPGTLMPRAASAGATPADRPHNSPCLGASLPPPPPSLCAMAEQQAALGQPGEEEQELGGDIVATLLPAAASERAVAKQSLPTRDSGAAASQLATSSVPFASPGVDDSTGSTTRSNSGIRSRESFLSPRRAGPAAAAAAAAAALVTDRSARGLAGRQGPPNAASGAAGKRRYSLGTLLLQAVPSLACLVLLMRDATVRRGLAGLCRGVLRAAGKPTAAPRRRRAAAPARARGGGSAARRVPDAAVEDSEDGEDFSEASRKCKATWCKVIRPPPKSAIYY